MKLLLKIMYNGSAYAGWQAQTELPSVQTVLTSAVSSALGFPCTVTGCSRTDAGVHAEGFCAAVAPRGIDAAATDDWLKIPVGKVHRVLSRSLPHDISVCGECAVADPDFHPRYSVKSKTYTYRMYDTPADNPFLEGLAWHLKKPVTDVGLSRMNEAARFIIGRRDFTSFMATGSKITDAVREVYSLSVTRSDGSLTLKVSADGFLYNMVRIITGTLTDIAFGTAEPDDIPRMLAAKNRTAAGKTAPAHGLYLSEVCYDREIIWLCD